MKRQLFILDPQMLDAMDPEEVQATWHDMVEFKLNKSPYDQFTLQIPFSRIVSHLTKEIQNQLAARGERAFRIGYNLNTLTDYEALVNCRFEIEVNGKFIDFIEDISRGTKKEQEIVLRLIQSSAAYYLTYLIVALATKNIERVTKRNSLAKFGIGKKGQGKDFEYVTTLSIGKLVEYEGPHIETGETRRPHLRRGHIRRQKYGPNFSYERKIWIKPIFVNGYSPNEDHRKAYNVTMR